ncbi:MAG: UrcA family protein [Steroidobacteraceae bacterium]
MIKRMSTALQHAVTIGIVAWGSVSIQTVEAAAARDVPQRTVRYADLDLSREADAKALYGRIQGAARSVCPRLDERALTRRLEARHCIRMAVSEAVERIDAPLLTALYKGQTEVGIAVAKR